MIEIFQLSVCIQCLEGVFSVNFLNENLGTNFDLKHPSNGL